MATDRIRNCYIYTNNCAPEVQDSALHLAAYNGRTDKFRALLEANPDSIYQRTIDNHNTTAFTVALSRGHSTIAAICLQQMELDLATLTAHFGRIGGATYSSHFWLRNKVMIITDPSDVQFARSESDGLLADPGEMRSENGVRRCGLILLLKPESPAKAEVLWLTARQSGDDCRLALIVARCAQLAGWLDIMERDYWGRNCFQIAARRNLPEFWRQMHASYGQHVLTRREYASSFRLLAEHQPADRRVAHFEELCRTLGGFKAADLFEAASDEAMHTYKVLQDALREYNGDPLLLDYLVELAARRLVIVNKVTLPVANSQVIQLPSPTNQEPYSLLGWAIGNLDKTLIWQCLRYEPDLFAKLGKFECDLIWSILVRSPQKPFEATLRKLIEKQILDKGRTDILAQLFRELCKADFGQTARLVWSQMSPELREDTDQYEQLLLEELMSGHFDTVQCLLEVLPVKERLCLLADALPEDSHCQQWFPDVVWQLMLPGCPDEWNAENVGHFLCTALHKRQMDAYERVWQMVQRTFDLKNARGYGEVSILFHSIYNALAQKYDRFPGECETDCREIIDSDDDAESEAAKIAANNQRPIIHEWVMKPAVLIVDTALEAFCLRIFEKLIADGADYLQIHPYDGQSLLHVAVSRNNLAVASRLLQLGLDPSALDSAGNVPMTYVRSVEMIALLPVADVLHVNPETQRTPLAEYLLASDYLVTDVQVVRTLVAAGADVHRRDETTEMAPLMMLPSPEVATILLQAGADVNAEDNDGQTALYRYRYIEHEAIVRLLLQQPEVDLFPKHNKSESLVGCLMRFIPVHELQLIAPQISVDQKQLERLFALELDGLSALSLVQRENNANNLRCVQQLLEQSDLDLSAETTKWTNDSGRFKLECGAHVSQRRDKRPLDWSDCKQPYDICNEIEFFARAGFNVDYNVDNCFQETALQMHAGYTVDKLQQIRIVAHLVAVGANYRLLRMNDQPVLQGFALECLYEWDEERGLTIARRNELFVEEETADDGRDEQ